jgi:hypothetical protein
VKWAVKWVPTKVFNLWIIRPSFLQETEKRKHQSWSQRTLKSSATPPKQDWRIKLTELESIRRAEWLKEIADGRLKKKRSGRQGLQTFLSLGLAMHFHGWSPDQTGHMVEVQIRQASHGRAKTKKTRRAETRRAEGRL